MQPGWALIKNNNSEGEKERERERDIVDRSILVNIHNY